MARKAQLKIVRPPKELVGEACVPGDKSITHRALILSTLASGSSRISNFSPGRDCQSTINCLRALGANIIKKKGNVPVILVHGTGSAGLTEANNFLDAGNSATTLRLLSGVLAAQPFLSVLTGDTSLRSRPMRRLIEPLRLMGAEIYGRGNDSFAPIVIKGARLSGIDYYLSVPSAQIKSAILLAGLFAQGKTTIKEFRPSRDHTERLLRRMGAEIKSDNCNIHLEPLKGHLAPIDLCVPGDISSAAYWLVAGSIHPNARIRILACGINPTRTGIIEALLAMGAKIKKENQRLEGDEPVADLCVESSQLKAIEISGDIVPSLIDEIPLLAVAACVASGKTVIRDASELRVKESDRIATTAQELTRLGAKIEELLDGMVIYGGGRLFGAEVSSHSDHRLAMSLAIASLVAEGETVINGADIVDISYPGFWAALEKLTIY